MLVRLLDESPRRPRLVRERFHAFTVDEYQDVNPLQQALLDRWLGGRDELCVVGDDYQTIYTFTGASPEHLLDVPRAVPGRHVVRLEENYRSSPQVLTVANALARSLGGFDKKLRSTRADGPSPTARAVADADAEVGVRRRRGRGGCTARACRGSEIAVLYRINARSEPYEEALAAAGVPYQVRDGAFLRRPGPRGVLARLRRVDGAERRRRSGRGDHRRGRLRPRRAEPTTRRGGGHAPGRPGPACARSRRSTPAPPRRRRPSPAFLAELEHRFAAEREGRGVQLMTYHRAKGLEFDAVFLPRLLDGELPYRARKSEADPDEERRLLYVGITRAREHLFLSWPREPRSAPEPVPAGDRRGEGRGRAFRGDGSRARTTRSTVGAGGGPLFDRLKEWRRERASTDGVPAYVVFHDSTLAEIAERKPSDWADLAAVPGIGPAKLDRYADEVLAIVSTDRVRPLIRAAVRRAAPPREAGPRRDSSRSPPSGAARRVDASIGSRIPSSEDQLSAHVRDVPSQAPDRRRQHPLGGAQHRAPGRGEERRHTELCGLREVRGEHRESAPRQREPEVGMERAAEQLEVVRDHEEGADHDEHAQPRRDLDHAVDAERDRAREADDRDGDQAPHRRSACGAGGRAARRARARRAPSRGRRRAASRPAIARRRRARATRRSPRTTGARPCTADAAGVHQSRQPPGSSA